MKEEMTLTPEEQQAITYVRSTLKRFYNEYLEGFHTFENVIENACFLLNINNLSTCRRQKILGYFVEEIVKVIPNEQKGRGRKRISPAFKDMIVWVVQQVHAREKLPLTKIGEKTAFTRTTELLREGRLRVADNTVYKVWERHSNKINTI